MMNFRGFRQNAADGAKDQQQLRRNNQDSDLDALLGADAVMRSGSSVDGSVNGGANSATAALNLDHLTSQKQEVSTANVVSPSSNNGVGVGAGSSPSSYYYTSSSNGKKDGSSSGRRISCGDYLMSYISMLLFLYPKSCKCFIITSILLFMVFLGSLMMKNPMEEYGNIVHDHSNIHSKYDIDMKDIDHWCLGGGNSDCLCEDPLVPTSRMDHRSWTEAFTANRQLISTFEDKNIDVAFLGESIVEELDGRWMGRSDRSQNLKGLWKKFQDHFSKNRNAKVDGVALGIAGDTCPNVLWRLMHGEMPDSFHPKVWWIILGSNDLARMKCSEEVVVLGILRVVEEILENRPDAQIVVNSMLPMTDLRGDMYPVISDYRDSFGDQRVGGRTGRRWRNGGRFLRRHKKRGDRPERYRPNEAHQKRMSPEELKANIEQEETERDQRANKKRKRTRNRPPPRNPIMEDRTRKRKYQVRPTPFRKKNAPPLWSSIRAINKQLFKFAENQDRVTFFDATELFAQRRDRKFVLLTDRISIRGHPTPSGFDVWEDKIVETLLPILERMKTTHPELFDDNSNSPVIPRPGQNIKLPDDYPFDEDDMHMWGDDDGFGDMGDYEDTVGNGDDDGSDKDDDSTPLVVPPGGADDSGEPADGKTDDSVDTDDTKGTDDKAEKAEETDDGVETDDEGTDEKAEPAEETDEKAEPAAKETDDGVETDDEGTDDKAEPADETDDKAEPADETDDGVETDDEDTDE